MRTGLCKANRHKTCDGKIFRSKELCDCSCHRKFEIQFEGDLGEGMRKKRRLDEFSDAAIEKARELEERENGKLPVDPRTDFPSFVIYEDGEEMAGG